MATTGIISNPIIHVYKEINEGKYKTTKHYLIDEVVNGKLLLSENLNINLNRDFAKSSPDYWLHIRTSKWIRLTGLFFDSSNNIYRGDKGQNNVKEDLILVRFFDNKRTMTVYYFKNYYTNDLKNVIHLIQ